MSAATNSNNFVKMSVVVFALLLLFPLVLIGSKIASEYGHLKDVRFQGERLLSQNMISTKALSTQTQNANLLRAELTPLSGTTSQANAQLQTKIRKMITQAGGTIDTISGGSTNLKSEAGETLKPIAVNVRWNGSEQGLGQFLRLLAKPGQNLALGSLNVRRRQGTGSLVDVRMSISGLWQEAQEAKAEGDK